jgi:predicted RNase H-like HicB family nuclease
MSADPVLAAPRPLGVPDVDVRYYLSLPYGIALNRDPAEEGGTWHAQVEELPGCEATGATAAEAAERVPAAVAEWVAGALAEGREVPEPRSARSYSGKLLLRMPLTLHAELARAAERDQVSLNAYITSQLAVAVGWRRTDTRGGARKSDAPRSTRDRMLWWALVVNLAVVGVAAVIAILLLVTAWAGG